MYRDTMWKQKLRKLELNEDWDAAIDFMKVIIRNNPGNVDAYTYMLFLLMNLVVEEDYNEKRYDYYVATLKEYFDESYEKFSENAEYLFCVGTIAVMSPWYLGIEDEDFKNMLYQAMAMEVQNSVYRATYFIYLDRTIPENQQAALYYAQLIVNKESALVQDMLTRGALGVYLLNCMTGWAYEVLGLYPYGPRDKKLTWKVQLQEFETYERWFTAILYMDELIKKDAEDLELYLVRHFLMVRLLVSENSHKSGYYYCMHALKKYVDTSYEKFSKNAEYLFWTGITLLTAPAYAGLTEQDCKKMIEKALQLEPNNLVYKSGGYRELGYDAAEDKESVISCARMLLSDDSDLVTKILSNGSLGEYWLQFMREWAHKELKNDAHTLSNATL